MSRPFGFFLHHRGRGHARRCEELIRHLDDRKITILSADRSIFGAFDARIEFDELPNAIGDPSLTHSLHAQQTPDAMQGLPLGSRALKENAERIVDFCNPADPGLIFNDVSVERALLSRLCSVPSVKVRMHGERSEPSHIAADKACTGLVAPFHADLEQPEDLGWARRKTCYLGGLCTTLDDAANKKTARARLNLPQDHETIIALPGGGGRAHAPDLAGQQRAVAGGDQSDRAGRHGANGQAVRSGRRTKHRTIPDRPRPDALGKRIS